MLNGAQIASLMNMIGMVKAGQLTRSEAINIVTGNSWSTKRAGGNIYRERSVKDEVWQEYQKISIQRMM